METMYYNLTKGMDIFICQNRDTLIMYFAVNTYFIAKYIIINKKNLKFKEANVLVFLFLEVPNKNQ
jgi:hypothetical protein